MSDLSMKDNSPEGTLREGEGFCPCRTLVKRCQGDSATTCQRGYQGNQLRSGEELAVHFTRGRSGSMTIKRSVFPDRMVFWLSASKSEPSGQDVHAGFGGVA